MLRSVKELENARVTLADGRPCGRVKDLYFDDGSWSIRFFKISLDPIRFGHKQVLLRPDQISSCSEAGCELKIDESELRLAPLDSSYLPVCRQYASFSPGSAGPRVSNRSRGAEADPHLRSAKAVRNYSILAGDEFGGLAADLIFDTEAWEVRYLVIERAEQRKLLSFLIHPQNVERISWSTQRILARSLEPAASRPGNGAALIVFQAA
jgi:hypothetical protein